MPTCFNPSLIRDKILNKGDKNKAIWDDELAPLMKVFRLVNPQSIPHELMFSHFYA